MFTPQSGDVIIRNTLNQTYLLVEAVSGTRLGGPFTLFPVACATARVVRRGAVWQQSVDLRGRLIGDPLKLPI